MKRLFSLLLVIGATPAVAGEKMIGNCFFFDDPAGQVDYYDFSQHLNHKLGAVRIECPRHGAIFPGGPGQSGDGWIDEELFGDWLEKRTDPCLMMLNVEGAANRLITIVDGQVEFQPSALEKRLKILAFAREHSHPDTKLGYFSQMPEPSFGSMFSESHPEWFRAWHQRNQRARPLADACDFIVPEFYLQKAWSFAQQLAYVEEMIDAARIYGKPVYLIWRYCWQTPRDPNTGKTTWEPMPVWRLRVLLRLTLERADGVILWGGRGKDWAEHGENQPWWNTTWSVIKEFSRN